MKKKEYGYVRVSTKEQNEERQMIALKEIGIKKENIYIDKQSGKDFNRPNYLKLMKKIKAGDTVFVKSIDRLGRNYEDIIDQWHYITMTKEVDIVVLDFPLLDTRSNIEGLTGQFIGNLVLQVLSYVAQVERENIKQRQSEGIKAAKNRGVQFGRQQIEVSETFEEVYVLWKDFEISGREAARRLGVDPKTFKKWVNTKEDN